jgi:uncharacterized protein (DUF1697 family)
MPGKQKNSDGLSRLATHVALLRGINVGGKNRLPMADLNKICAAAGCEDVRTYIQSGNVLFNADAGCAKRMPKLVESAINKRFGFSSPVIVRTAADMTRITKANPFPHADENALYVGFLADKPTARRIAELDPDRSPGDEFRVIGREIYLNLAANGASRTKLTTAYFDSKLQTVSTFRNWRTTVALLAMMLGRAP